MPKFHNAIMPKCIILSPLIFSFRALKIRVGGTHSQDHSVTTRIIFWEQELLEDLTRLARLEEILVVLYEKYF